MSSRILIAPLLALSLLPAIAGLYSVPVQAQQNGQETQPDKPEYYYVCPMHSDVTSKKPGKCRICKMELKKKKVKEPVAKPSDQ